MGAISKEIAEQARLALAGVKESKLAIKLQATISCSNLSWFDKSGQ